MLDITTIGEVLIDLTQTGCSEQGVPLFAAYPGGAPANVAVAAAKLGASTAFVGKTGQDEFGSYLRRVLAEHGVDVTGLHTDRSPTSLAVVSVSPGGERSFRFMRGADTNLSPDEIDEGWVDRSKVLHFGSVSLTAGMSRSATIFAARRAHKTGKLVSYDPNYRPSLWRGREEAMQWLQIPLPLAGLVKCANCGQNMQRMVMKGSAYLLCTRRGCCASTKIDLVEGQILNYLTDTLAKLTMDQPQHIPGRDTDVLETALSQVRDSLAGTDRQKNRLYELLELGEYDLELFRERLAAVKEKRAALEKKEAELERSLREIQCSNPALLAEKIRAVLDAYSTADAAGKNALLKSVLESVWYKKEKKTKPADFQLQFVLRAL